MTAQFQSGSPGGDREGKTFADRHPELRGQPCWCVDCGEPAKAEALTWWQECATCDQWWRDNPPPGAEKEPEQ